MSERWWVGKGPNGGYVAAVILRAIQASASAERAPRSLTVHYQRAPLAGPVEIGVEVEREGGRVTFLSARMTQEGKVQATAQAVLSENWSERRLLGAADARRGRARRAAHDRPGRRCPGAERCCRTTASGPPSASRPSPAAPAHTGAWIRTREPRLLDAPLAAAFLDTWFPAPFVRLEQPVRRRRRSTTPSTSARRCRRRGRARGPLPGRLQVRPRPPRLLRGRRRALVRRRHPAGAVAAAGAAARPPRLAGGVGVASAGERQFVIGLRRARRLARQEDRQCAGHKHTGG